MKINLLGVIVLMKRIIIRKLSGMQVFSMIWFGEFISIMGTAMTKFAMMIWAYEQAGKASTTAMLGFSAVVPYIILSPIAGAIVDKLNRRKILIFSDIGAGIVTIGIMILYVTGKLEVWHLFIAEALSGGFESFQIPAYQASITMLIPKDKFARASGMRSFAGWSSQIFAPILAGILILKIGVQGIMTIDIVTFVFAVGILLVVNIPQPKIEVESHEKKKVIEDISFALSYLKEKKGLLKLMIIFVAINLISTITYFAILPAMILARTGNDKLILSGVQSLLGAGGVVGSLIVSIWGCPNKKVLTILVSCGTSFLLGDTFLAIGKSYYFWYAAAFLSSFFLPFNMASQNSLWQSKVEPTVQGRIFSIKSMIELSTTPIGYLLGGFLADNIFEPLMKSGTILRNTFGNLVGVGSGSGMAVMFLFTGILGTIICLAGYFLKDVRNLEKDLQDFDEV